MTGRDSKLTSSDWQQPFQAAVDEHYQSVWQYAAVLTRETSEAEDIAHQAFLLLFDRLIEQRPIDDSGAWLRGVVRNLVREWWRKNRRLPAELTEQICLLADQVDDATAELRHEREAALSACLDKLSEDDRQMVRSRYEDGDSIVEIAERCQMKAETARVRLFRIRERLKTCVELTFSRRATE